jgi:hypothetical protein
LNSWFGYTTAAFVTEVGSLVASKQSENNLLVALHKYAHQQDENFTTESFVHLLRHLQVHDPDMACVLFSVLTDQHLLVTQDDCRTLAITTQQKHEQGVTDIIIRGPDKYVIVEVKIESQPGWKQLDRYNELLGGRPEKFTFLVLLSRFPVDPAEVEKTGAHVRWNRVARTLKDGRKTLVHSTSMFLVEQFLDFLRERGMAVDKVSWELVRGMESLKSLMSEIYEATATSKDIKKRAVGGNAQSNGIGFSIETTVCWAGIYYSKPQTVLFEAYKIARSAAEKLRIGRVESQGKGVFKWVNELDLESEAVHFFALSPDNQQRRMEEFIREGVSAVKKILDIPAS